MLTIIRKISGLVRKRPAVERRLAKRLTPSALTPCLIRPASPAVGREPEPAWIHNLSKTGVGIITPVAVLPGTMIRILMFNAAHMYTVSGEVKVVRCMRVVSGHFLLGGEFTDPLQHDAIVPFMV
jgi:hypothetical protein